jgi:hypothetical protein
MAAIPQLSQHPLSTHSNRVLLPVIPAACVVCCVDNAMPCIESTTSF